MRRPQPQRRRAATVVEFAVVLPATLLLVAAPIVIGLGIFRYQQVARLARDASRWASVHGSDYALETGNSAATPTDVYNQVIVPNATGLALDKLTYSVTWNSSNSPYRTATVNGATVKTSNTVSVTVTYDWIPEAFLAGITMRSTSVAVMSY